MKVPQLIDAEETNMRENQQKVAMDEHISKILGRFFE